jgi:hypothetical protein
MSPYPGQKKMSFIFDIAKKQWYSNPLLKYFNQVVALNFNLTSGMAMNNAVRNAEHFTVLQNSSTFIKPLKLDVILGLPPGTCEKIATENYGGFDAVLGLSDEMVVSITTQFAFTTKPTREALAFAFRLMKCGTRAYVFNETGFY